MNAVRKLEVAEPRPRSRRERKKQPKQVEYIHFETHRYRIPLHILFTLFLIFAGGVGTASSFALLQSVRHDINITQAAIQTEHENNVALRSIVHQHFTVEEIYQIATERLNMGFPDTSQIVRINVPTENYVIQSDALTQPQQNRGMWYSAFRYIRNWLGV